MNGNIVMEWTPTSPNGIKVPKCGLYRPQNLGSVQTKITTIGIDLAKEVFQIHGVDSCGKVAVCNQVKRNRILGQLEKYPLQISKNRSQFPRLG